MRDVIVFCMALPFPGMHGAYLRAEIIEHCGRRRLANALACGEVRPRWSGVVVDAARELDPWTNAAAALLSIGQWAVLSHTTAAYLHGCRSLNPVLTHVLLPYGVTARGRRGLVVHRGGYAACDVAVLNGLRVLAIDRALSDVLCTAVPSDALAAVDQALKAAGPRHESLRSDIGARLDERPDRRGTLQAGKLLDLSSPRIDSPAESWLRLLVVDKGIPVPAVNWPILGPDGLELFRLDLAWVEIRVCLEYDGYEAHAGREVEDARREDDLRRRGWIVVRAGAADLADPTRLLRELREAFAARGHTW